MVKTGPVCAVKTWVGRRVIEPSVLDCLTGVDDCTLTFQIAIKPEKRRAHKYIFMKKLS